MARLDPHSYCDDTQAQTKSFALHARVDFPTQTIHAEVTLVFRAATSGRLDLDTRDLTIEHVEDASGQALTFQLHPAEPHLGQRLSIELAATTPSVTLRYRTSPEASALQWLEPAQTKGGTQPFLFSQCQAIHARSLIPMQDTPRLRVTYTAVMEYPRELTLVMAAADRGRTETETGATHRFEMPQPIPRTCSHSRSATSRRRDLSPRCRVWAEPAVVDAAAYEFADVEAMIGAAEALFGPYDWERFDILTMRRRFRMAGWRTRG